MEKETIGQLKTLFKRMMGYTIAYMPKLAPHVGGATPTIFLSQLVHWSDKGEDKDGWIYKTREEWKAETGLTRTELETSRRKLRDLGILEEEQRGINRVIFYRLNWEVLWVAATGEKPQNLSDDAQRQETYPCNGNPSSQRPETGPSNGGKPADGTAENLPMYTTKTTSEITQRIESTPTSKVSLRVQPDPEPLPNIAFPQVQEPPQGISLTDWEVIQALTDERGQQDPVTKLRKTIEKQGTAWVQAALRNIQRTRPENPLKRFYSCLKGPDEGYRLPEEDREAEVTKPTTAVYKMCVDCLKQYPASEEHTCGKK